MHVRLVVVANSPLHRIELLTYELVEVGSRYHALSITLVLSYCLSEI